jgi:UDP-glucose 6-dehydrogenase
MKISMIGTGYVGLVTGACLADAGNQVLCLDLDAAKIKLAARDIDLIFNYLDDSNDGSLSY